MYSNIDSFPAMCRDFFACGADRLCRFQALRDAASIFRVKPALPTHGPPRSSSAASGVWLAKPQVGARKILAVNCESDNKKARRAAGLDAWLMLAA
ncbi:hypothetical protein AB4156_35750 [Cupriavidus sp. 2MCAB6]|uniref:hypothetical protein n=1 Tax=Cupriavidus sp. 2MCAB6 TaxID=3232981 RepID=UPI003F8F849F